MSGKNIVVLGVGNILLRDEGVGVRVIEELQKSYTFPSNVRIVDGGTQGLWLLPTIQEADHLIVVDAVLGTGGPGTMYRLEKDDLPKGLRVKQSAHDSDLIEALNLCALLDKSPETIVVLGIQPEDISAYGLELTPKIASRVPELVDKVLVELSRLDTQPIPL